MPRVVRFASSRRRVDDLRRLATPRGVVSPDHVWAFTAPASKSYTFQLLGSSGGVIYVAGDCTDIAGTCLGASEVGGPGGGKTVSLGLIAGQSVLVVIDGDDSQADTGTPYILYVE